MAVYKGSVVKKAYKGDYGPCQIYKGTKKYAGFTNYIYTGQRINLDSTYNDVLDLTVRGNVSQVVTPKHDKPSSILFVGDPVLDTHDVNYGRYKIPICVNSTVTTTYIDEPLRKNKSSIYDELDVSTGVITRKITKADMKSFLIPFITEFESTAIEPENLRVVIPNECLTYERFGGYHLPVTPLTSGVNTLGNSNRYITSASYQQTPAFVVIPPNPNIYYYYDATALGLSASSTKRQVRDAVLNWLGTIDEFFITYQVQTPYTETTQGVILRTEPNSVNIRVSCQYPATLSGKIKRMVL